MQSLLFCAVLAIALGCAYALPGGPIYVNPASNCSFTFNHSKYDFSSLVSKSGGYSWQQNWNNTAWTIQLQVCGNIGHPALASATNLISSSGCLSGGQGSVFSWDQNPYQDGFFLSYYHGTYVSNILPMTTHVYFMCNSTAGKPTFEHITDSQIHISWNTPLACPTN